ATSASSAATITVSPVSHWTTKSSRSSTSANPTQPPVGPHEAKGRCRYIPTNARNATAYAGLHETPGGTMVFSAWKPVEPGFQGLQVRGIQLYAAAQAHVPGTVSASGG